MTLPMPGRLPMRKMPPPLRICSHYIECRVCDLTFEAIGSTEAEAERRAVSIYADHVAEFHYTRGEN